MSHCLGRTEQDSENFNPATQNSTEFKMYELVISGAFGWYFRLYWLDSWTLENEIAHDRILLSWVSLHVLHSF